MSTFPPESFIVADVMPSPNHDERKQGRAPDLILLHYTGMQTGEAALARLCAPDSQVSSHYVVFEDGRIVQCVAEELRAWHAGVSSWGGKRKRNPQSETRVRLQQPPPAPDRGSHLAQLIDHLPPRSGQFRAHPR